VIYYKIAVCDDDKENLYTFFHDNEDRKITFMSSHFPEYDRHTESRYFVSAAQVQDCIDSGDFDFDLVITDVNFGGDSLPNDQMTEGLDILEMVKLYKSDLDVILVTGYSQEFTFDDIRQAFRRQPFDWLKKARTGESLFNCLTCGTPRSEGDELICRGCGDPLEKFQYDLNLTMLDFMSHDFCVHFYSEP